MKECEKAIPHITDMLLSGFWKLSGKTEKSIIDTIESIRPFLENSSFKQPDIDEIITGIKETVLLYGNVRWIDYFRVHWSPTDVDDSRIRPEVGIRIDKRLDTTSGNTIYYGFNIGYNIRISRGDGEIGEL